MLCLSLTAHFIIQWQKQAFFLLFTECNFSDLTNKIFVAVNKLNPVILVWTKILTNTENLLEKQDVYKAILFHYFSSCWPLQWCMYWFWEIYSIKKSVYVLHLTFWEKLFLFFLSGNRKFLKLVLQT